MTHFSGSLGPEGGPGPGLTCADPPSRGRWVKLRPASLFADRTGCTEQAAGGSPSVSGGASLSGGPGPCRASWGAPESPPGGPGIETSGVGSPSLGRRPGGRTAHCASVTRRLGAALTLGMWLSPGHTAPRGPGPQAAPGVYLPAGGSIPVTESGLISALRALPLPKSPGQSGTGAGPTRPELRALVSEGDTR